MVIVQEAPRRFRWRHKCAALADDFGMVVAAGGLPSLGNLLLVSLRVRVHETWCLRYPLTPGRHLRGAAFARVLGARRHGSRSPARTWPPTRPSGRPRRPRWKEELAGGRGPGDRRPATSTRARAAAPGGRSPTAWSTLAARRPR